MTKQLKIAFVFLTSFSIAAALFFMQSHLNRHPIEFVTLSSVSELKDKLKDKDTFVLQLSLDGCEYCEHLSGIEKEMRIPFRTTIYSLDISSKQKNERRSELAELIDGFEFYPSIFFICDGEVRDEFNLDESSSIESRLTNWLEQKRCTGQS